MTRTEERFCEDHGSYISTIATFQGSEFPSMCPRCMEEQERTRASRAKESKKEALRARLLDSGIPERYLDSTFQNYHTNTQEQKKAHNMVSEYAANWQERAARVSTIFLCGSKGTGKTHLAISALRAIMEHEGKSGKYTKVLKMMRHIRSTYNTSSKRTEQEVMDEYINTPLLVLDEVGKQLGSEHEKAILFEIIDERYGAMRSTIIISNKPFKELESYLGEYAVDRLKGPDSDLMIMNWESYRRKK